MVNRKSWRLALTAAFVFAGVVLAQPAESRDEPRGKRAVAKLSPEQQKQIAETRVKFVKEASKLEADLRVKQAELRLLWLDQELDEKRIVGKVREIEKVRAELREQHTRQRIAMLKLLTPEQRAEMRMGRRGMKHGQRRGEGARPGRMMRGMRRSS